MPVAVIHPVAINNIVTYENHLPPLNTLPQPPSIEKKIDQEAPCFDNLFINDKNHERSLAILKQVTTILDELARGINAPKDHSAKSSAKGTINTFPLQQQRCLISLAPQALKFLRQNLEDLNKLLSLENTDLPKELLRRVHNQTSQKVYPLKFFQNLFEKLVNNQINENTLSLLTQLQINADDLKKRIEANLPLLLPKSIYVILKTAAARFGIREKLQRQLEPEEYQKTETKAKSCTAALHGLVCWFCIVYPEQNLEVELQKIAKQSNFQEISSIDDLLKNFIPHSKNFIHKLKEDCAALNINYQTVVNWVKNNPEKFRFGGSFEPINTIYGIFLTTDTRTDSYLLKEILEKDPSFLFSTNKQGETKTIEDIWSLEKSCQDRINQYEEIQETIVEKLDQIRFYQALEKSFETYKENCALEVKMIKPSNRKELLKWLGKGLLEIDRDNPQQEYRNMSANVMVNYKWSLIENGAENGAISLICQQTSHRSLFSNYSMLQGYLRGKLNKQKEEYYKLLELVKTMLSTLCQNLPQSILKKQDMPEILTCLTEWLENVKNSQDLWSNLLKLPLLKFKTEQAK
ncbi:MAG TPA: hypothetical protein PKD37_04400 [Oligoflexia bacterium]|nr:hypothetical protein [Oligoflexia bacterium]HMP27206.1 hypothetical protein [Oligoflexia bacterium]